MSQPIYYVLSNKFDYTRLICDDAGPAFAKRQGWIAASIADVESLADKPHVFDNRLHDDELPLLQRHIERFPDRVVMLKVVDPGFQSISQPYYHEVLLSVRKSNVLLLGPYHPTDLTQLANRLAGREAYRFFPYCYDESREVPLDPEGMSQRGKKVFFSGNVNPSTYPDRWRFYKAQRRTIWGWRRVKHLRHPGYPDVGVIKRHNTVGDAFVEEARTFCGFWVDGASSDLELLKFAECAYAGCAPFGISAKTLPPDAAAQVWSVPPGDEARAVCAGLERSCEKLTNSAQRYRAALRASRQHSEWNRKLLEWWSDASRGLQAQKHHSPV